MRVLHEPGFVLHQRFYGETSLLLEVFTSRHGRIGLLAKGARRPRTGLPGILKPFQPLLLGWSGRGELPVLTAAETDGAPAGLAGMGLYCGFYLNELLVRLLHRHDAHEALYTGYSASLRALAESREHEAVLRGFEKQLLQELGYGLVLDRDVADGSPIRADAVYDYAPDRGPIPVYAESANEPPQGIRVRGESLLALAANRLEGSETLRDAKVLMRAVLARHLGDKPLHSRRLFQGVRPGNGRDA